MYSVYSVKVCACVHVCACVFACVCMRVCVCDDDAVAVAAADDDIKISQTNDCFIIKPSPSS